MYEIIIFSLLIILVATTIYTLFFTQKELEKCIFNSLERFKNDVNIRLEIIDKSINSIKELQKTEAPTGNEIKDGINKIFNDIAKRNEPSSTSYKDSALEALESIKIETDITSPADSQETVTKDETKPTPESNAQEKNSSANEEKITDTDAENFYCAIKELPKDQLSMANEGGIKINKDENNTKPAEISGWARTKENLKKAKTIEEIDNIWAQAESHTSILEQQSEEFKEARELYVDLRSKCILTD